MTSKFLERFKASAHKNNVFSENTPINKRINPEQVHNSVDSWTRNKPTLKPISHSQLEVKQLRKIKVVKKYSASPTPYFESMVMKPSLPELNYSNHSSSSSNHKMNSRVNSFEASPVCVKDLNFEKKHRKKSFSPYPSQDFRNGKPNQYILLGGLGPNIGHENWKIANEKKQKMINYWRVIKSKKA